MRIELSENGLRPRLLADIGGTNARFALETAPRRFEHIRILACRDHATLADAVRAYLGLTGHPPVRHAAIAIANPVTGDRVKMTNHHWTFSIEEMRCELGWQTLLLLNDFTAQALAVAELDTADLVKIGGGIPDDGAPKAVLGAGTGLGVSGLIPDGRGGYIPLAGEGGHVSFAPADEIEAYIWQYARHRHGGHVSAERLISGMGLELIYDALRQHQAGSAALSAADITGAAIRGDSMLCKQALDIFCSALGTVAANLALTLGARGGVYLCGGIVPRFIPYFETSPFRRRFEDKGRFSDYLAEIPVYIVQTEFPGITGAAAALEGKLHAHLENKFK